MNIGEIATRTMVYAYRDMRAAGIIPNGSLPGGFRPLTVAENDDLWTFIHVEIALLVKGMPVGFPTAIVARLAYAIAQTEQYTIGSERYCAWQAYEIELHKQAITANR